MAVNDENVRPIRFERLDLGLQRVMIGIVHLLQAQRAFLRVSGVLDKYPDHSRRPAASSQAQP